MSDRIRQELLELDQKKQELLKEKEIIINQIKLNPGWGVDEQNYPQENFPHVEQSVIRARLGEIEVELPKIYQLIDEKMEQYFLLQD
ncbi:Conserved_hypothetical protein [Hexamita inflata]|uniref:Uncharacterized protein n=1 Tax=Hexamita inflata TaxID=28002 RepID=A0AA86R2S8_9EUKA|nr:Conserved hypothetical protein [Hexamita inflata]CAI9970696.1 Conserved hypothetical protein [Hexamita inflata]